MKDTSDLSGHLLIAVPDLPDDNFFRSVVLMLKHTGEGATGVILNRPSNVTVSQVWDEVAGEEICDSDRPVYVGGPVQGPLIAIHQHSQLAESEVLPGVFVSMERDNLNRLVTLDACSYRIYSGYSGWGADQLENELAVGGWLTLPAKFEHVFGGEEELWKVVCEHVGHEIMMPHFPRKSVPIDPSMN